jgi:DNA-binding IclR family transcriptional regulator
VRALFPDASAFVSRHGTGPQRLSELRRLLTEVRRTGSAREDGEVTPGFASVAAAVHDHAGRPVAAVAVTFPTGDDQTPDDLGRRVANAAAELTRRISGRPPERV